jgi:hypothetical protein
MRTVKIVPSGWDILTGNGVAGTACKLTEGIKNTIRKVTNIEIDLIHENIKLQR